MFDSSKKKFTLLTAAAILSGCFYKEDNLALFGTTDDKVIAIEQDAAPDNIPNEEFLAAIKQPTPEVLDLSRHGNSHTYEVDDKTYKPLINQKGYTAKGIASWYGKKFHGQRTANGEIYDLYKYTAAHPTLPLPCIVRVTNLETGQSVMVRVNDRGPFKKNREIDLSYIAAKKIGLLENGTAKVEVKQITNKLPMDEKLYKRYIQIGAYTKEDNAKVVARGFIKTGTKFKIIEENNGNIKLFKVLIGPMQELDRKTLREVKRKYQHIVVAIKD